MLGRVVAVIGRVLRRAGGGARETCVDQLGAHFVATLRTQVGFVPEGIIGFIVVAKIDEGRAILARQLGECGQRVVGETGVPASARRKAAECGVRTRQTFAPRERRKVSAS